MHNGKEKKFLRTTGNAENNLMFIELCNTLQNAALETPTTIRPTDLCPVYKWTVRLREFSGTHVVNVNV